MNRSRSISFLPISGQSLHQSTRIANLGPSPFLKLPGSGIGGGKGHPLKGQVKKKNTSPGKKVTFFLGHNARISTASF